MKKALQFISKQALLWCLFLISGVMMGQNTFTLVTQESDLVAGGKYLVSNGSSNGAVSLLGSQASNNRTAVAGTVSTNSIVAIAATASSDSKPFEITLGGSSGAWTLSDAINGTLLGPSTGSNTNNYLKASAGTPLYTITFSGNAAIMTCYGSQSNTNSGGRNIIRFNTNLFASYNSGQSAVYLFRKEVTAPTQTSTPTFSFSGTPISSDTYAGSTTATLSTSTSGATIYYTVDGSTPTSASTTYVAPFNITSSTTIKALATFTGLTNSAIATKTITIVNPPANDLCSNAIALISNNPATNGTLANASVSSPFTGDIDVWYKITPTYNETYTFTTSGFTDDVDVYLYNQGNACPSSTTFVTRAFTFNTPEIFTSALISGVTYYVRVVAASVASQNSFTIQVTSIAPVAPTVTPATVNGNVGTSVNYQIVASNAPTAYSITTGTLPSGLSLNTTSGIISGTPTTAGNSSVTVTATNATGTSTPATLDFTIAKGTQTITFAALANNQYGDSNFNLAATSTTATPITYESSNTSVATVTGNIVTVVGVGNTNITASQAGTANYNAAANVVRSLTVTQRNLTVSGLTGDNKIYNASAAATVSGTAVLNNVLPGDAANVSLSGTPTYSFATATVGVGKPITASGFTLSGSAAANYSLTQPTSLTATIEQKVITATGFVAQNKVYDATTVAAITGGTITGVEASDTANIAIATAGVFASANVGTGIAVTVSLTGSAALNYTLTQPGITANITKANQTITFDALPALNTSSPTVNLNSFASASSSLALTYESSDSNVVSVSGNTLTVVGVGTAVITASQAGNLNYNAATNATQNVTVTSVPTVLYSHNFNDTPAGSPYSTSPLATAPAGVLNGNIQSSAWVSSTGNFTSFGGKTGAALVINPSSGVIASMTLNLTIAPGFELDLTDYSFWARRTNSGPQISSITVNGLTIANAISITTATAGADVVAPTFLNVVENLTGNVSIVLNLTAPSGGSQNLRLDDFTLTGFITQVTTTWNGTSWTNNAPTATSNAIIAADYNEATAITAKNLTINTDIVLTVKPANTLKVAGNLTNNGSIVFKSDATGTASFASYTGAAIAGLGTSTVERYIPAKRAWRLLTAPLKGNANTSISSNWQGTNGEGLLLFSPASLSYTGYVAGGTLPNIRKYNVGYQDITDLTTQPLFGAAGTDTKSFLVFATGPVGSPNIVTGATATTIKPTGQLITGDINNAGLAVNTFHLLSNPYASAINPVSLIANNSGHKLWLIDPSLGSFGAYVTYDGSNWSLPTPTGTDALIQSGQGFFTRSTATNPSNFSIKESDKAAGSSNTWFEKNANTVSTVENADKIRVLLYKQIDNNWKLADAILSVNYNEGSNEINAMDSNKISNFNESIMFRNNTTNLSIEHRALPLSTEIQPLRLTGTSVVQYQLRVYTENYTNSALIPVLEDTVNGTFTEIPTDGSLMTIPFTGVVSSSTNPDNRFQIVYQTNLSTVGTSKLVASVFPNPVTNNQLNVNLGTNTTPADYTITNLLGQAIQKGKLANTQNVIQLSASQGFYILNISQEGKSFTTKIYVQ